MVADVSTTSATLTPSEIATKLTLTEKEVGEVEEHTRGQAGNQVWHDLRKCRITASNFKSVMSCKKQDGGSPASRIVAGSVLDFEPAPIEWGRKKEKVAAEHYSQALGKVNFVGGRGWRETI